MYIGILWFQQSVSMLATVRSKTGTNVQKNLMVPAVLDLVSMLGTVRRKSKNVQKDFMSIVSMFGTMRRKSSNVQIEKSYGINSAPLSQHAWNSEKEKQERTEESYGP